jgi:hypothetical protein
MHILRIVIYSFFSLVCIPLTGQTSQNKAKITPYLLDSFVDGTLYYKASPPRNAKFNYHLLGQEVVMDFNDNKVPVNSFPNLDSVHIGDRNFILVEGKSYEQVIQGPVQLLMDYKYTSQIEPNTGAYGTKSHAAAVVVADQRIKPNDFYALTWNEGYELVNRSEFYIVQNDKWSKFSTANQLGQIFKDKKNEIKDFASQNKTNFNSTEDVKELVNFILGTKL